MTVRSLAFLALALSCARGPAKPPGDGHAAESSIPPASLDAGASDATEERFSESLDGASAHLGEALVSEPADAPFDGRDFIAETRTLFRVAACGPSGEVPSRFDTAVVDRHCDALSRSYAEYRKAWVDIAKPFIASLRPKDVPSVVVYPFGGGDLTSALATFPDATETTSISLEPAGDVRPIDTLPAERLARDLAVHRSHLERLFEKAHSRTDNLEKESKSDLPGEIIFALAALAVQGEEPVSMRYFRLSPGGSIVYVTQADIDSAKNASDRRSLFTNAELRFKRSGAAQGPTQVFRHIGFNLDDFHVKAEPGLLAHLSSKGRVSAMTKAASHLLWNDHFSLIRSWLLEHTDWMISDSTGIPPRFATPAGFVQEVYGKFNGPAPFGLLNGRDAADFKNLFASQPSRDLGFRYGYPDSDGHAHMIITRRSPGPDGGAP